MIHAPKIQSRLDWCKDELILALDLYFRAPQARGASSHPEVIELSDILQTLPFYPEFLRPAKFRNPNGVAMKLSNFMKYDASGTSGLARGAKLEQDVWAQFANNRNDLTNVAALIRALGKSISHEEIASDDGFPEGAVLLCRHKRRERDSKVVKLKKKSVLTSLGTLSCEVCEFNFFDFYGELGLNFAECHHTRPVASMSPGEKTRLRDLSIVCANCHRMLHRSRSPLSIADLRKLRDDAARVRAVKNTFASTLRSQA